MFLIDVTCVNVQIFKLIVTQTWSFFLSQESHFNLVSERTLNKSALRINTSVSSLTKKPVALCL